MAIRIRVGDMVVEVDTAQELRAVLPILGGQDDRVRQSQISQPKRGQGNLKTLYQILRDRRQGQLLRALRQHPEGMNDSQLRRELALPDNSALAGVISGVSKNAKKVGIDFRQVITKESMKGGDGKRVYHYKLGEEMANVVPGQLDLK